MSPPSYPTWITKVIESILLFKQGQWSNCRYILSGINLILLLSIWFRRHCVKSYWKFNQENSILVRSSTCSLDILWRSSCSWLGLDTQFHLIPSNYLLSVNILRNDMIVSNRAILLIKIVIIHTLKQSSECSPNIMYKHIRVAVGWLIFI